MINPEKTLEKQIAELVDEKPGGIISTIGRSLPEDVYIDPITIELIINIILIIPLRDIKSNVSKAMNKLNNDVII